MHGTTGSWSPLGNSRVSGKHSGFVAAARTLYGSVVVINVQRDALYYDNRSRLFGSHKDANIEEYLLYGMY